MLSNISSDEECSHDRLYIPAVCHASLITAAEKTSTKGTPVHPFSAPLPNILSPPDALSEQFQGHWWQDGEKMMRPKIETREEPPTQPSNENNCFPARSVE